MAKNTLGGYMGHQVGKLGQAVGYVVDGVQLYRAYNAHVKDPRTELQLLQRAKLAMLGNMASTFKVATCIGFQKTRRRLNNYISTFTKANKDCVIGNTVDELTIDFSALSLSEGSLVPAGYGSASSSVGGVVEVPLTDNSKMPGASASDKVYVVVYQPDTDVVFVGEPSTRSASKASVSVPEDWSGLDVHVYAFACAANDNSVGSVKVMSAGTCSPTSYLGTVTIV